MYGLARFRFRFRIMQETLIHPKQVVDLGSEFDWAGILGILEF